MSRYNRGRDPYWTTARFDSIDANGNPVKRGDRIFCYPNGKVVLTGDAAQKASAEFEGAKQDESFYASQY